jgi:serine/threonine protein kinase
VKVTSWDPIDRELTMEYMPNGRLKDHLLANNDSMPITQCLQWVLEAAEGLQLLHSAKIVHCDVKPKKSLLDANLGLRIAEFSGASLDSLKASACARIRFIPHYLDWRRPATVQNDLLGLGSTIYSIMAGHYPFQELPSNEATELYDRH